MDVPNRLFGNDLPALDLVGRQSGSAVTVGTTVLPIGAIIGIAIVGSAILFGVLTVMIMHYLRFRYKLKNGSRDLDLSDDNEEDILDALRSTAPSERQLVTKTPHRPLKLGSEALPKEWTDIPLNGRLLDKSKLMPPAYAFEITGLRDSWPLAGRVGSPYTLSISANKHTVVSSGNTDRRTSYSAFPLSMDHEPSWPQASLSRSSSNTRGLDSRPIQWSGHSAKSSITSLKRPSSSRKSISDNQLTTILRSTSQRLREQRRPLSRSLSVMSQVSGAPPTMQPPSPPRDQREESREALIDTDDASVVDSVRSSVLNSISQTPSPQKMAMHTAFDIKDNGKITSPVTSEKSVPDSLCPSKTPDLFIPASLTSPSKRGAQADQRYPITIPPTDGHSNAVHQEHRQSLLIRYDNDMNYSNHASNHIGSTSDPFVSADVRAKSASKSRSVKGPRPLIKRQAIVDQNKRSQDHETITSPLREIFGNQKPPTKSALAAIDLSAVAQENPFQWSPRCSPSLVLSPGQKPLGIKQKGHRRRRTVRLSHVIRPASVAVVLEEPESGSTPPRVHNLVETQKLQPLSPTNPETSSMDPDQYKSLSRPPSVPIFEPFLVVTNDVQKSSDEPSSATMSFYDIYSSGGAFTSDNLLVNEPSHSPTPSTKKSRRRGYNFSIDVTRARDVALLEAAAPGLQEDRSVPPPKSTPAQFLKFDNSNDAMTMPNFALRLDAPSSPQHHPVGHSVTSSVSLLRRMNSEVSTGSFISDHSNGSPSIPELRGGGLSPTKRGSEGTMNYLSIGVKTPSPTGRRGRVRNSANVGNSRDYHQTLILEDHVEHYNALGLVMPILEGSPHKLPSLEPLANVSGQDNWRPTPPDWTSTSPKWPSPRQRTKPPAAQLRPTSSAPLSQEKCHSCNKPLSPLRLNPRDSALASRYHDHCFKCSTCNDPLGTAFAIDKKPYCKLHYYEKVNEICSVIDSPSNKIDYDRNNNRWSEVMTTPLKKSVRHESQLEMPSPHGGSPSTMIEWRGSLGLYDEMGFLKSSPDRGHDTSSFRLEPAEELMMGT